MKHRTIVLPLGLYGAPLRVEVAGNMTEPMTGRQYERWLARQGVCADCIHFSHVLCSGMSCACDEQRLHQRIAASKARDE